MIKQKQFELTSKQKLEMENIYLTPEQKLEIENMYKKSTIYSAYSEDYTNAYNALNKFNDSRINLMNI